MLISRTVRNLLAVALVAVASLGVIALQPRPATAQEEAGMPSFRSDADLKQGQRRPQARLLGHQRIRRRRNGAVGNRGSHRDCCQCGSDA